MAVITIDRLAGTRDREVAAAVANRLGYRLLDDRIDELVRGQLAQSQPAQWDERLPGFTTTWFLAFSATMAGEFGHSDDRVLGQATEYVRATQIAVQDAVAEGSVVIVGRGASVLAAQYAGCLRVFLCGEERERVRAFAVERGIAFDIARTEARRIDATRRDYVRRLYSRRLEDPRNYDLVVDTTACRIEEAADTICNAASARFGLSAVALSR